jgi:hypothetical protein
MLEAPPGIIGDKHMRFNTVTFSAVFMLLFLHPVFMPAGVSNLSFAAEDAREKSHDPEVDFRWAFAAMSVRDGNNSMLPVTQDMVLKSGDQLKMMVELQRRCFVYIFHHNGEDDLKMLFPYALQQFGGGDYQPGRRYYVPRGDAWFTLDQNPGREVFYLIASSERLDELEKAYLRYDSAEGPLKARAAGAVLDRIKELRREHRELTSPAERPVPIGGALRSVDKVADPKRFDIAAFADEILSTGFVARTYSIEHK